MRCQEPSNIRGLNEALQGYFMKKFKRENGGGFLEYVLLAGLVALLCLAGIKALGLQISATISDTGKKVAEM